jgi:hypothetical protein
VTRRPASPDLPSVSGALNGRRLSWSPWRTVVGFGVVSLAADMVYEGARSVTGPLLASLGASAVLVGLVSVGGRSYGALDASGIRLMGRPQPALLDPHLRRLRSDCGLYTGPSYHAISRRRRPGLGLRF